jgi:hypothetical protein
MRKTCCAVLLTLACFAPFGRAEDSVLKAVTTFKTGGPLKIVMPEPSSPALLTVDLLSAGALVLLLRRKTGLVR